MVSEIEALRAELAALRSVVRELADRQAIAALIAAYGPAVDRGDSAGAARLWSDDGTYDLGAMGSSRGPIEIAALFDAEMHQSLIQGGAAHMLGPPSITLAFENDPDRALAVCYSCVVRWTGSVFELHRVAANRWTLRREATGWRIVNRANRLLDGAVEARNLLA